MKKKTPTWIIVLVCVLIVLLLVVIFNLMIFKNLSGVKWNLSYGFHEQQVLDFYSPGKYSDVLVVVVHGGAWFAGDKIHVSNVAGFLSQQGYAVANINYRLAPNAKIEDQLKDILSALDYLDLHKEDFKLKENYKVVLIGHSAGAHLCALYGLSENNYAGKNVDSVIGLAGPYDLTKENERIFVNLAMNSILGGMSREDASPVEQVEFGESTKFLLVLGEEDEMVEFEQMQSFENALREKGVYVETLYVEDRTHETIFNQMNKRGVVGEKVLGFVGR